MTAARSSSRVSKVDAGSSVEKKDVVGRVVEPLAPVTVSSSGIEMLAQAKLSVGRVDDPAELEADEMAQKFLQWSDQGVGGVDVSEGSSSGDAMRSAETGTLETGGFEVGADVQSEISSRSGRGEPLADGQRAKFEKFFNKDLSAVRVHADSDAARLSGSLGADAFTVGSDVYFGAGRYQSGASDKLLAHELTHVVQQNSTVNRFPSFKKGWDNLFNGRERNQKKKAATRFKAERDEIRNREENEATHIGDDESGRNATFAEGGKEFSIPYEGHIGDDESGRNATFAEGGKEFSIPFEQRPAPTYEVPISNETYQANKRRGSVDAAGYQIPASHPNGSPEDHIYSEIEDPRYQELGAHETYQASNQRGSVDAAGYQIPVTQEHLYSEVAPIYTQPVKKGDRKSATPPPVPPKMNSAAGPTMNPWAFKGNLRADQGRSNTNAGAAAPSKGKAPSKAERERLNKQAILENSDSSAFGSSSTDDPIYENVKRRGRRP
jgi:hypothetical protein